MSTSSPLIILAVVVLAAFTETLEQAQYKLAARHPEARWRWWAGGIVCHVAGFVMWFYLLSKLPLGIALPLTGLCYVTTAIGSKVLLSEKIGPLRQLGMALILGGLVVLWLDGGWQ